MLLPVLFEASGVQLIKALLHGVWLLDVYLVDQWLGGAAALDEPLDRHDWFLGADFDLLIHRLFVADQPSQKVLSVVG